jgi:hypothetical protein
MAIKPARAGPEYLAAARQVFDQLGEISDRGQIFNMQKGF